MKIFKNAALIFLIIGVLLVLIIGLSYNILLQPVSNSTEDIEITINKGMRTEDILSELKKEKLIRNEIVAALYIKINKLSNFKAGKYTFNKKMGTKKILDNIIAGNYSSFNDIVITFPEGSNINKIARIIAKNTDNTEEDVKTLLTDTEYITSLTTEHWFISDEIKNANIYYPLEGYLFPDTYNFRDKSVPVKEIFAKMLEKMGKVLGPYKSDIAKKDFTIHQFLTFASVVESEGVNKDDRDKIASVFYNRLKVGMAWKSCVTVFYALKEDMSGRALKQTELDLINPYNTYPDGMAGKMPVGPISNPGKESMEASLYPDATAYLYFLSDKNLNTYFFKTYAEQVAKKQKLINEGTWLEDANN